MPVFFDLATLRDSPNSLPRATLMGTIAAMVGISSPSTIASIEAVKDGKRVYPSKPRSPVNI